MSGAIGPHGGLTRRSFLKTAGVAAGALGLAGAAGMTTTDDWLAPAKAYAEPEEKVRTLCHQFHCLSACGLKCTVRDGRLALIEPVDFEDGTHGRVCLRGLNEVQHVYAEDRIQTPLRRVGERGEGKFEQISWEEALKEIGDRIKESQEKYGENSVFYRKSTEASCAHTYEFLPMLLHMDVGGYWGLDRGQANGSDYSGITGSGLAKNSIWEWKQAKTVVHLGSNLMESAMTWTEAFLDAKEAGAYMIGIDPRFSPTMSKCDKYLPVKPGTDGALVLGAIKEVVDNAWYDAEHMAANTSFPFLVDEGTGEILGKMVDSIDPETGEPAVDPATGETLQVKVPLVWDAASKSAKYLDEDGIEPAIEGSYEVDGKKAVPEFEVLKKHLEQYSVDWASQVTGIPAEDITMLADRVANNGPCTISFGFGGPDKYTNADVLGHASAVLIALTGNSGKAGAGLGFYGAGGGTPGAESIQYWTLPEDCQTAEYTMSWYDMVDKPNNIHAAITFGDAFMLEAGDANKTIEWIKGLDFYAIVDIYNSSAVAYADIVLPACTKFECEEDYSDVRTSMNFPYVYLNQKCIDPLFESKSDVVIERLIAAEFGKDDLLPQSYEELAKLAFSVPEGNMEGMTFEAMKENGYMKLKDSDGVIAAADVFADQTYPTPTGKVEVYYEQFKDIDQAFPTYVTPNEAFEENPKKADYPLVFMQGKSRFRIHAYYSASAWFQEYFGPVVNVNPADAEARGIQTGDDVRIANDRGEFVARALVNDAIQPGTLFMAETTYNHYYKEGFLQNVTNAHKEERAYDMTFNPQVPYNDTLVEMKKA